MPAQKKTTLGLNQWIGSEYPKRIDFVEDNKIINDELLKRVEYTDAATEEKKGIAQIHSLDTVENQSNELQNIIANNIFCDIKSHSSLCKQRKIKNKRLTLPKSIKIK